jgi:hypothetical protein
MSDTSSFTRGVCAIACAVALAVGTVAAAAPQAFDHTYQAYAKLLARHVHGGRVDYQRLVADRAALVEVTSGFGAVDGAAERAWPRDERLAFWINAYNLFTLQAIVDHYPIRTGWFTLGPRNSIRQIAGVWDRLSWRVAGRQVTLDDIEHRILRPEFKDPRIHFAVNCASAGCPPLRSEPYRASTISAQLDANARSYLASPQGLRTDGKTLVVTSILKWYGDDFVERFGAAPPAGRAPTETAILRVVEAFGPAPAAALARDPAVRIRFLDYDWSLNDVARPR